MTVRTVQDTIHALWAEANACKKVKDWAGAAAALAQSKTLVEQMRPGSWSNLDYAKMLQRAGDADAALAEIDWLLAHVGRRYSGPEWAMQKAARAMAEHKHRVAIHTAAALICKRAKRPEREALHRQELAQLQGGTPELASRAEKEHASFRASLPEEAVVNQPYYKLLREATALKKAGDWDGAIAALRESAAVGGDDLTIQERLRLPLYLAQAGRMDEAEAEFTAELAAARPRAVRTSAHLTFPTDSARFSHANEMSAIHDKMRVAFARGGQSERAKQHGAQAARWREIGDALSALLISKRKAQTRETSS